MSVSFREGMKNQNLGGFEKSEKNFLNESNAVGSTLKVLNGLGYQQTNLKYINKGRYCLVQGDPNIAILLKTEPFFNFGQQFKIFGEKGVGDSINVDALRVMIQQKVELIYVRFRDGKLYMIRLDEFLKHSHKWTNKEGKELRSVSIHRYQRIPT